MEPDLIHTGRIDLSWRSYNRPVQSPALLDAFKRVMKFCEVIHLIIRTGELRGRVPSVLVQKSAVDYHFGTYFIKHHVQAILPKLWKVLFYYSSSVVITVQRFFTKPKIFLPLHYKTHLKKIRITRKVPIPPISQAKVRAACPTGGSTLFRILRDSPPSTSR